MTRKLKYILTILLAIVFADMAAQNSQIMYYMNLPQNHLLNPAMRPSNKVYIGLPALSGVNLNINNNFVNFSDVFMPGKTGDSVITFLHPDNDINDFIDKIKDKNSFQPQATVQLFGLGFSAGKNYVFFDVNERIEGNMVIPGDIFKLALLGNESFVGDKIDLSSLRGDIKYYREIGAGFSRDFTSKLRIGVKAKLLKGIATASIVNRSFEIAVNDDYTHSLDADMTVNVSAPLRVYMDSDQNIDSLVFDDGRFEDTGNLVDFLMGKKNTGFGIDIGATFDVTEKLIVSAAITDIGFIKWKKDLTNINAESQFTFSGLNMTDVINGSKTFDELGQEMLDSLKNSFKVSDSKNPFTTYLPVGLTLGGSYNLTKNFSVGVLSYSRFIGKQIRESLTLSANANFGNAFSTSVSYTAANNRFDNLGLGLAFRPGIFQFYVLSDRIPIMWNRIKTDGSTIPLPASWNTIHLRFGMNLVFGNKVKKKDDKPMVLIEENAEKK
jgi:hypothetical protein